MSGDGIRRWSAGANENGVRNCNALDGKIRSHSGDSVGWHFPSVRLIGSNREAGKQPDVYLGSHKKPSDAPGRTLATSSMKIEPCCTTTGRQRSWAFQGLARLGVTIVVSVDSRRCTTVKAGVFPKANPLTWISLVPSSSSCHSVRHRCALAR